MESVVIVMESSRVEKQLERLLGKTDLVQSPDSRVEHILEGIYKESPYNSPILSKIEEGFVRILNKSGNPIENPGSRVEYILNGIIQNDELSSYIPRSRIEKLLKQYGSTRPVYPIEPVYHSITINEFPKVVSGTVFSRIKIVNGNGKTIMVDGEQSPDNPLQYESIGDKDPIYFFVQNGSGFEFKIDGGLRGIPHHMDAGNITYSDPLGVQWFSDSISPEYKSVVIRTKELDLTSLTWVPSDRTQYKYYSYYSDIDDIAPYLQTVEMESTITNLGYGDPKIIQGIENFGAVVRDLDGLLIIRTNTNTLKAYVPYRLNLSILTKFENYLSEHHGKAIVPINQEIKELTDFGISGFQDLYANNGETIIDSNFGSAFIYYGMEN